MNRRNIFRRLASFAAILLGTRPHEPAKTMHVKFTKTVSERVWRDASGRVMRRVGGREHDQEPPFVSLDGTGVGS